MRRPLWVSIIMPDLKRFRLHRLILVSLLFYGGIAAQEICLAADARAANAAVAPTANWQLLGPRQPMRAEQGGDVGRINAVVFHPTQPRTFYIGTPIGGLWRTEDDGLTWNLLEDFGKLGITDIAIDQSSPDTMYVLTGDGESNWWAAGSPPSIGVRKSTDGGKNWEPTGLAYEPVQRVYGHRLAIDPKNPAILIMAGSDGVHRTVDGGKTWSPPRGLPGSHEQLVEFWDVVFHPTDPSIVYAASATHVYRSDDAGQTWSALRGGLPDFADLNDPNLSNRIRLGVTPASPNTLYVLYGGHTGFTNGLYRSDDRGNTFTKRSSTSPVVRGAPLPIDITKPNILGYQDNDFKSQSVYTLSMAISPTDVDRVNVGAVDTWQSEDGGRTWKRSSYWRADGKPNFVHADVHVMVYHGDALFAASDGGVFRSTDGAKTWAGITKMSTGVIIAQIYKVCYSPKDPDVFYYGAQDNGTWRLHLDGDVEQVFGGDGMICQVNPKNPQMVYAGLPYGRIVRSDDGGQNFQKEVTPTQGANNDLVPGTWVTPYILSPADPDAIYGCYGDLWYSPDDGFSWKNLTNGALGPSVECRQMAISPAAPNTIYVAKNSQWGVLHASRRGAGGDARPPFLGGGGLFRSTDGGLTWKNIGRTLPLAKAEISNLAVSPMDARRVWVTFFGNDADTKVFETKDGGGTWTNISAGLPNLPANVITADNGNTNGIYVGLDDGVYYRDDHLGKWVPFLAGLPHVIIMSLLIDDVNHRLIAGTYGRGVWMTEIGSR